MIEVLEKKGKLENTLIIFTSDNGGLSTNEGSPTCNFPAIEGKGWMYEGGLRVPLIVYWKDKLEAGSVCETPVTTPDFYPTLLEIAEIELNPQKEPICDGVSILPLLKGKTIKERPIFWHYPHYGNQGGTPGSAVRLGDWKLIVFFEDNRCELYNIQEDLEEKHNRAAEFPQKAEQLKKLLEDWQQEVGAKIPQPYVES